MAVAAVVTGIIIPAAVSLQVQEIIRLPAHAIIIAPAKISAAGRRTAAACSRAGIAAALLPEETPATIQALMPVLMPVIGPVMRPDARIVLPLPQATWAVTA